MATRTLARSRPSRSRPRSKPTAPKPESLRLLPQLPADHAARIARLRDALAPHGVGHALITNPLDVAYLTGFLGGDSYLLVGPASAVIISDFRYREELEPIRPLADIHIRTGSMAAAVGEVFAARKVDRAAIQPESVTLAERDTLAKAIGSPDRLAPAPGLVAPMRARKDASEVRLIRNAARIQQAALLATLPTIRPGQTELEVAARLEAEMKCRGSSRPAFETIVAAKANGALPHYRPHPVKIAKGQPLLIDWGAVYQGYCSDMTRTFSIGKWSKRMLDVYNIVLDAHRLAAEALAPGKTTFDIDAVARAHITRHGLGDAFGHGLGHGIGLNVHEDPRLSHMTPPRPLEPGMIVTIEPGVYLPGIGGVRLENDYLITDSGAENLCSLPMDPAWAVL